MSKSRKKKRKSLKNLPVETDSPRILVIRRGIVSNEVKQLANNLRLMLSPNCASRLKEGSRQKLRDFTSVADLLGLSHLLVLSQSSNGTYLKIANLPKGPTITFQVNKLSLISDIVKHMNNPSSFDSSTHSPLLVLNGFSHNIFNKKKNDTEKNHSNFNSSSVENAMSYVTETLNNMIAPIDLVTTKIQNCKRVVLFHKQKDTNDIVLRHYSINLLDCNTSSQVKDLLTRKTMKNLIDKEHDFQNILGSHLTTDMNKKQESSFDSDTDEVVELDNMNPQTYIAKNKYGVELDSNEDNESKNKVAIRLIEIGPRLSLSLIKVQDDVFTGSVKYHKFVKKTPEELEENKKQEPTILNKRRLESERVMKIYQKYVKNPKGNSTNESTENKEKENKSNKEKNTEENDDNRNVKKKKRKNK